MVTLLLELLLKLFLVSVLIYLNLKFQEKVGLKFKHINQLEEQYMFLKMEMMIIPV